MKQDNEIPLTSKAWKIIIMGKPKVKVTADKSGRMKILWVSGEASKFDGKDEVTVGSQV